MTQKQLRSKQLNWMKLRLLGAGTVFAELTRYMERFEGGGGGEHHELYHELRMLRVQIDNFTNKFRETLK